jgi:tetratricopeptide (TPR) repeat protein
VNGEDELAPEERERLGAGDHESLARELEEAGRHAPAARVREQIWDFAGASAAWLRAGRRLDALRAALDDGRAPTIDTALRAYEDDDADARALAEAAALLQRRKRHHEAARLLALADSAPEIRARALVQGGDRVGAARLLADAGHPQAALQTLDMLGSDRTAAPAHALAAALSWDLGDAEAAARHAQQALRGGVDDAAVVALLARSLASCGHDLAAEMVLPEREAEGAEIPGRYRVTGLHATGLVGAAYLGFDRTSLEEVEIHLLLAELPDVTGDDPAVVAALDRFATIARAAASIGHPAIRPILELRPEAGLLVVPRAEGPELRALIRPPGLLAMPSRARALTAFMLEGLEVAHARALVHGWLLPGQIVCDAVGRPVLGPFGAHHLAGLAATHTGSLEEILGVTAPEVRAGGPPTVESDLYSIGALLGALLVGGLNEFAQLLSEPPDAELAGSAWPSELALARALCATEPRLRPTSHAALERLRAPVADVRELDLRPDGSTTTGRLIEEAVHESTEGVVVEAAPSWPDALVDALCAAANPWYQPVLDRTGRRIVLAPWPVGCRSLGDDAPEAWRELVPAAALLLEDPSLVDAIEERLRPSSLVHTPANAWMLALDDLLAR